MGSIILSIHKPYSDALLTGKKRFEFRKLIPSRTVDSILVYEAKGCGMVVGELQIAEAITGTPEEIWNTTKNHSGIDRDSFFRYYQGRTKAVAYVVGSYLRYESPRPLSDFGISRPPQNYVWVEI